MKTNKISNIIAGLLLIFMLYTCSTGKDSSSPNNYSTDGGYSMGVGKGGSLARFTISGQDKNYLYAILNNNYKVFNISDAAQSVLESEINTTSNLETIFPLNDTVLLFGTQTGMLIYNTKNSSNPQLMSNYQHIYSCDPVVANDKYAFVTLRSDNSSRCGRGRNELQVVDITNLYNPKMVKNYAMTFPKGLGLLPENRLAVCDDGLKILDVSNLNDIKVLHHQKISANDVIPLQSSLLVIASGGLYQYKYENNKLTLISNIPVTL
ncbi:MAG: hypothetical protein NW207_05840 [Cytophagales bacterium]|nr:hypothetical protein [Cytophagales bacterium]